jgi:glycosyltransferase involved in cell wall biosynthesis
VDSLQGKSVVLLVENYSVPADRRVWAEATSLRDLGCRVSVVSQRRKDVDREPYAEIDGIPIHRFSMPFEGTSKLHFILEYSWAFLASVGLVARAWRRHGLDALHVANPPDMYFPLGALLRLLGKKFVFDMHDLCPETYASKFEAGGGGFMTGLLRTFEYLSAKAAHSVIVTNESYRDVVRARCGLGRDEVYVVRNSPNLKMFDPRPPKPELKRGREYLVTYVGVMGHQDGVDYLLRAAHHILHTKKRRDVLFVIVGSGDAVPELKRLHQELGLGEDVIFTGRIPDDPMLDYLSTADVCAAPDPKSPLNDISTMQKTMEYMAMGKAQVVFDLKEARYSAGEAAVFIEDNDPVRFGEAILDLLADPDRRRRLGALGQERIRGELSWERSRERLRAAYLHAFG